VTAAKRRWRRRRAAPRRASRESLFRLVAARARRCAVPPADRVGETRARQPRMVGNRWAARLHGTRTRDAEVRLTTLHSGTRDARQLGLHDGRSRRQDDGIAVDVGGGFGVRLMYEYFAVLLAGEETSPGSGPKRSEFPFDEQGRDVVSTSELALDARVNFLRCGFRISPTSRLPLRPAVRQHAGRSLLTGVYECRRCAGVKLAVRTRRRRPLPRRGPPVMSYMIERLVDMRQSSWASTRRAATQES